jgi:hypothetical protein
MDSSIATLHKQDSLSQRWDQQTVDDETWGIATGYRSLTQAVGPLQSQLKHFWTGMRSLDHFSEAHQLHRVEVMKSHCSVCFIIFTAEKKTGDLDVKMDAFQRETDYCIG